jgi:hypothetical protein
MTETHPDSVTAETGALVVRVQATAASSLPATLRALQEADWTHFDGWW